MKIGGRKLNRNKELWVNGVMETETVTCFALYSKEVIIKGNKES